RKKAAGIVLHMSESVISDSDYEVNGPNWAWQLFLDVAAGQNSYRALSWTTRGLVRTLVYLPKFAGSPSPRLMVLVSKRTVFETLNASARICSVCVWSFRLNNVNRLASPTSIVKKPSPRTPLRCPLSPGSVKS